MNTHTSRPKIWNGLIILLILTIFTPEISHSAAIPTTNVLDSVVNTFRDQTITWGTKAEFYATRIFFALAVIGLIWNCGFMVIERADIGAFFATFIRWMLFVGFFWWLTINASKFADDIITSFAMIGADIGNIKETIGPSAPINIGLKVMRTAITSLRVLHPLDDLTIVIVGMVMLIALGVIAANMLLTLCSAWILAYAGALLVGFGAVKWTSDIAINYFRTVLGVAVTYMTMLLIVSLCLSTINGFAEKISDGSDTLMSLLVTMIVAVVLSVLVQKNTPYGWIDYRK